MSKFVSSHPQTLYHSIPGRPRGDAIETSSNYGATLLPAERKKLGMLPDKKTPLVFAATCLGKALAFAIPKGEKLFNHSVDAANAEIVIASNRKDFMAHPINATIFSFSAKDFVQLPNMQHQSVSTMPVPFSKTTEALKVSSVEDLMRAGLQIFSFEEKAVTLHDSVDGAKLLGYKDDIELMATLGELVKSGRAVWENHARGIGANPKLAEMMGMKMPMPRQIIKAHKSVPKP